MSCIQRLQVINPAELSKPSRAELTEQVFAVHRRVFAGVDMEGFRRYVVESSAERTRLALFWDGRGRLVGYAAVHMFLEQWQGKPLQVWRAETGLLPEARGGGWAGRFITNALLKACFTTPLVRKAYLGAFVHPAPYTTFLARCPDLYPRQGAERDPALDTLINDLAVRFGMPKVQGRDPGVRQVGWRSRSEPAVDAWWRRRKDPASRYFVERNPEYDQGYGLLVMAMGSPMAVVRALSRVFRRRAAKGLRTWTRRLNQLGLRRWVKGAALRPRLDELGVNPVVMQRLTAEGAPMERLILPSGVTLAKAGRWADDYFLVLKGVVAQLDGDKGCQVGLLSEGDLVEAQAPKLRRRWAHDLRTHTPCELVRVPASRWLQASEAPRLAPEAAVRLVSMDRSMG